MDRLFKALNDATRRRILELLRRRSLTAGEIADACTVSKSTVSHHLDLLMQAELIEQEKAGQFRHYYLNTSVVQDVLVWLDRLVAQAKAPRKHAPARHLKSRSI